MNLPCTRIELRGPLGVLVLEDISTFVERCHDYHTLQVRQGSIILDLFVHAERNRLQKQLFGLTQRFLRHGVYFLELLLRRDTGLVVGDFSEAWRVAVEHIIDCRNELGLGEANENIVAEL